ncbi:MAG: hypothetical protein J6V44_12500 [Methanobrevibacter sp.]|nr:hypothetical protein [Methanobrevibacter sp.]
MEIDVVKFSAEVAEDLMWDKYGDNWDELENEILAAERQIEYDHIYEMIFFGLIWNFPQMGEC